MGRLHDGSGNSHRGAVAPFLDHRPHIVITPCIYIVATFCHEFGSVSTMLIPHRIRRFSPSSTGLSSVHCVLVTRRRFACVLPELGRLADLNDPACAADTAREANGEVAFSWEELSADSDWSQDPQAVRIRERRRGSVALRCGNSRAAELPRLLRLRRGG